jgi:hypothetical protein
MALVYLDEHLGDFSQALTSEGHDVVFAGDAGRTGREDAWHFGEALRTQRAIVTLDKGDFLFIHRLWTTLYTLGVVDAVHAGILTAAVDSEFARDSWLVQVRLKLADPPALAGRMLRWLPAGERWKEEQRPER